MSKFDPWLLVLRAAHERDRATWLLGFALEAIRVGNNEGLRVALRKTREAHDYLAARAPWLNGGIAPFLDYDGFDDL